MGWKYDESHGWENDAMRKERYANVRPFGEAAGIIAGVTVIGKTAKKKGFMKSAGIAIAAVFIAATARFILTPVFAG